MHQLRLIEPDTTLQLVEPITIVAIDRRIHWVGPSQVLEIGQEARGPALILRGPGRRREVLAELGLDELLGLLRRVTDHLKAGARYLDLRALLAWTRGQLVDGQADPVLGAAA